MIECAGKQCIHIDPLKEIVKALKIVRPDERQLWDRIEWTVREKHERDLKELNRFIPHWW